MSTWSVKRRRLATLAIMIAALTALLAAQMAPAQGVAGRAGVYVAVACLALFFPAAIAAQVIVGQVLVGSLLVGMDPVVGLLLAPVLAGVVASAELLAAVARLDRPVAGDSGDHVRSAGASAILGGAVFGAVALAGGIRGPSGFVAVGLAAGACIVLAGMLEREATA